jgi:hypothetical protein
VTKTANGVLIIAGAGVLFCVGRQTHIHSALRPLKGLLCQPQVIMMDKLVESSAGEIEILGENLFQCRFVHHNPHMLPAREHGPLRWEASDNPLELRHGPANT